MTEFLTENAGRAYPLEREWPAGMDAWSRAIVDASVSTNDILGDDRLSLLSVAREGSVLTFTVGVPGTTGVPVTFDRAAWTGGRTAVAYGYGSASGELPPYKARLEYLESTGTQYIDSGVICGADAVYRTDSAYLATGAEGCDVNSDFFFVGRHVNGFYAYIGGPSGQGATSMPGDDKRRIFVIAKADTNGFASGFFIDGVKLRNAISPKANTTPFYLFACAENKTPNVDYYLHQRKYSAQIWNGGILVRDFIPVIDWDDEPKMFDLVTQTYPTHYGDFVAGPVTETAKLRGASQVKALLTLNVEAVDALLADLDEDGGDVGVPFAMRCSGGAIRRVTSITAQGPAACTTPMYTPDDPHKAESAVPSNEHALLEAKDGVDLEVTGMAPLVGDVLRVSAVAAPEAAEEEDEPVDLMIRGDECFSVETIPGAKVSSGGAVVAREEADGDGGVVRIGAACKPCCQCEDYRDAVNMLRPAEAEAARIDGILDGVKATYQAALAAFNYAKEVAAASVNSLDNVRLAMSVAESGGLYEGANTVTGKRRRITATLVVENMTMLTANVGNISIDTPSGSGYEAAGSAQQSGPGTLAPGEALTVVRTFRSTTLHGGSSVATRPTVSASCSVALLKGATQVAGGTKTTSA